MFLGFLFSREGKNKKLTSELIGTPGVIRSRPGRRPIHSTHTQTSLLMFNPSLRVASPSYGPNNLDLRTSIRSSGPEQLQVLKCSGLARPYLTGHLE